MVEALVRHLYGHVLLTSFGGRLRHKGSGALDARRLGRLANDIGAHLGHALSLADVAALSPSRFQRSFHRATGCTPHRFVAPRGAERARERLAQGHAIAKVADEPGSGGVRRLRAALAD